MRYFRIETVNGPRYVKNKKPIRSREQASELFQEEVIWVYLISPAEYIIKKLVYLALFGAITLPLTGVWSGSLIAGITDLPTYPAFLAIAIGSMVATALMLICSLLFGGSVIYLLFASLILIFIVFVVFIKSREGRVEQLALPSFK